MPFDYGKVQGIASKVMDQFIQATAAEPITLVSVTKGTGQSFNPGTPTEVETAMSATVTGVPSKFIERGLAVEGDLMVIGKVLAGVTVNQKDDVIMIGTKRYKIVEFLPTPPAGVAVVWKFVVRR